MLGNIFERYGSCLRWGLGPEILFGRGGLIDNEVCWRDIYRKILYLLLHRRIDNENWSKIEGIRDSFAKISKGLVPFSIRHVLYMYNTSTINVHACSHFSPPILVALPNSKHSLNAACGIGLHHDQWTKTYDRSAFHVCSHQILWRSISLEEAFLSLSRRTKFNQKKNKSDTFTRYVYRIYLIYLMICER